MRIDKNSILTKITLEFILIIIITVVIAYIFIAKITKSEYKNIDKSNLIYAKLLINNKLNSNKNIDKNFFKPIYNIKVNTIEKNSEFSSINYHKKNLIKTIIKNNKVYLYINFKYKKGVLYSTTAKVFRYQYYIYIFIFIIVMFYILIMKKLLPLRELSKNIELYSSIGKCSDKLKGSDELSVISKKFSESVKNVQQNIKHKNLYIRNIMHELKTPITKGRIVIEMLKNDKHKDRLLNVFIRLENIIQSFVMMEQIDTKVIKYELGCYKIKDLLNEADNLSLSKDNIDIITDESYVCVDKTYFVVAIKNLIDNGLKYSKDGFVRVIANEKSIEIISKGDMLNNKLHYYTKPFVKGNQSSKNSLGLGLYIVDMILKNHQYKLEYEYFNNMNVFKIIM